MLESLKLIFAATAVEKSQQVWHLPKGAARNANEALRAKLRRETPGIIKRLEDEWREMHEILMRVVQP